MYSRDAIIGTVRKLIPFTHRPFRSGQRDGNGQQLQIVFGSPNVDTAAKLSLGRIPQYFVQLNATVGGVLYNGSNQGADWTAVKIVLRATVAGTYNLVVF